MTPPTPSACKRRHTSGGTDSFALVTGGWLAVAAPGKGNMRVYVLNGPGRIGSPGAYLK